MLWNQAFIFTNPQTYIPLYLLTHWYRWEDVMHIVLWFLSWLGGCKTLEDFLRDCALNVFPPISNWSSAMVVLTFKAILKNLKSCRGPWTTTGINKAHQKSRCAADEARKGWRLEDRQRTVGSSCLQFTQLWQNKCYWCRHSIILSPHQAR